MKVAILVECGRSGLEAVVVKRLCELLHDETGKPLETEIVPLDNKRQLILDCGVVAAKSLAGGCERVVVLWDEIPAWPDKNEKPCWHNDRMDVLASLKKAKVDLTKVKPVCIEREFESWLLFDHPMLQRVLSRPTYPASVKPQKNPDKMKSPKGAMGKLFREQKNPPYNDLEAAPRFARHLEDLKRIGRCKTFIRFREFLLS